MVSVIVNTADLIVAQHLLQELITKFKKHSNGKLSGKKTLITKMDKQLG